jgi:hypothetical protein
MESDIASIVLAIIGLIGTIFGMVAAFVRWAETKVVAPVVTAITSHVDTTAQVNVKNSESLAAITEVIPTICKANCYAVDCQNYKPITPKTPLPQAPTKTTDEES